jgi:mannosyl-glycoprotein endo-beta-N-acetylglucosaminidase
MKLSLSLTTKYISLFILLFIVGNGGFTHSSCKFPRADFERSVSDKLPLFVKVPNFDYFSLYQVNPFYLPVKKIVVPDKLDDFRIMTKGSCSVFVLTQFLQRHNSSLNYEQAKKVAELYLVEAGHEGVNHDIAFSQMCLETGFLTYTGTVKPQQNNFCGLGTTSKNCRGEVFENRQNGVRAHIQHLKAYASTDELKNELIDRRYRFVHRGTAPTIRGLTGKWASDPLYDQKIEDLLKRLYSFSNQAYGTML